MKDLQTVLQDWEAVIGLEVHTELTTLQTKMFCSCKVEYGAEPNTQVCPVCLGLPGALPVPNKAAIECIVLAGLATNCEIEKRSMFYRKNYFYPDMSKDFQITQGPVAFCMRGWLDLPMQGNAAKQRSDLTLGSEQEYNTRIGITRIHMEEDAGKMIHKGGADGRIAGAAYSLVDYNRCGTPLIELVTEPDLRTPEEARSFLQKLRQIYLTLGISDCSMEEGSLRCDGNVSLRRRGTQTLGTKTELKNMNSYKNLHDGLSYEICRQAEVLESGGTVLQETRHWEAASKRTITLRAKETADDYRLFPEPDLAPYDLSDQFIESIRARLPELPDAKKQRFISDYGLVADDAAILAADVELSAFFDRAVANKSEAASAQTIANLLLNDVLAHLNSEAMSVTQLQFSAVALAELAAFIGAGAISSKQGKEVLAEMLAHGTAPGQIIEQRQLRQVSDSGELETIVAAILAEFPDKVAEYQAGKRGLLGFFVGQAMKATGGQANPQLLNQLVSSSLDEE